MSELASERIVLLSGAFQVRGSSAYTLTLAERLKAAGLQVHVLCSDASAVSHARRENLGIREVRNLDVPIWNRVVLEGVKRQLDDLKPRLIHVQSRDVLSQGAWLAKALECPFILTLHDYLDARERFRFDLEWGRRIIAVSDSVKSELVARTNLAPELVSVIHTGVDVDFDTESLQVLGGDHVPVVGTASPLEVVKGLHFFLGAAQRVLASGREVQFLIAGAGPEEHNLRRLARTLEIQQNVTFMPNLWDFSVSLAAMDIFCLPSLRQGLGTIMFQAMALGKPVIATSVGGVHSVVRDNENALVVLPSNSTHLAERIIELLDDPERARAIGMAGRQTILDNFRSERMIDETMQLYEEVIREQAQRQPVAR